MRAVARLDAEGFYVEPVLIEGELPRGHAEITPFEGLYSPRWDGSEWVEGKPDAEIVEVKRPEKVAEMHQAALDELAPLFTAGAGENEVLFLMAGHVLKLCEALGVAPDPRLSAVVEAGQKALSKKAEAEAAQTRAELAGITWDAGP